MRLHREGLIWAGTNDGKVWYTKDGGAHWTDVSKNITGMPTISKIEPSHFDPGTANISVDFHLMDNRDPSLQMQLRIRNDIDKVSQMVNRIEWTRKQLEATAKMLAGEKKEDQLKAVQAMDQKMKDVEYKLVSKFGTNSDNKYYSEPYKIYLNLIWLNGEVGTGAGDVAGGANFRPTDASVAVLKMAEKNLAAAEADYRNLMNTEVPAFNKSLAGSGIAAIAPAAPTTLTSGR